VSSASAIYGQAELANYCATKFFVRGITEALDIE
jgi:short-subunit dehydrogenase